MRRRAFLRALAGAAAAPLASRAQQAERLRHIGVLMNVRADDPEGQARIAAFRQALQAFGWEEERNLRIDYRFPGSDHDLQRAHAHDLAGLNPEVILVAGAVARVLQRETGTIPIVFIQVDDPVLSGLVASLPHPGGNITGVAASVYSMAGKMLEVLREIAPAVSRVAVMRSPESLAFAWPSIEPAAAAARVGLTPAAVRDAAQIEDAIVAIAREANSGLVVLADPTITVHRKAIIALAAQYKLPAVYSYRNFVAEGGLVSYGTSPIRMAAGAASYVDRILRGAKPADLPVVQPTQFELVVNLKTAKALGLEIPPTLLARADEVIE
jgi:putative tryptophan/tyrosine transport system substrate-binding protein